MKPCILLLPCPLLRSWLWLLWVRSVITHPSPPSVRAHPDFHLLRKGFCKLVLTSPFSVSSWTSSLATMSSLSSTSVEWRMETFSLHLSSLLEQHWVLVGAKLACIETNRIEWELSKNHSPNILGCLVKQSLLLGSEPVFPVSVVFF